MELLIFLTFTLFFFIFLKISLKLDSDASYVFMIINAILLIILGIVLLNEGFDITTCISDSQSADVLCETINYSDVYVSGLGSIFFALSLFFIAMSYFGWKKRRQ